MSWIFAAKLLFSILLWTVSIGLIGASVAFFVVRRREPDVMLILSVGSAFMGVAWSALTCLLMDQMWTAA